MKAARPLQSLNSIGKDASKQVRNDYSAETL